MKRFLGIVVAGLVVGAAGSSLAQGAAPPTREQMLQQLTRPEAAAQPVGEDDVDIDCREGSPTAGSPACRRSTRGWSLPGSRPAAAPAPVARPMAASTNRATPAARRPAAASIRAAAACAAEEVSGSGLNLCVTFALGSTELTGTSRRSLDTLASILTSELSTRRVAIEGHADASGSAEVNRTLSQRRAQAVVQYLAGKGVPADRLTAEGYGADRPIAGRNGTDPLNRRVQARLIG